jgi:hypothetical protein
MGLDQERQEISCSASTSSIIHSNAVIRTLPRSALFLLTTMLKNEDYDNITEGLSL